MTEDAFIKYLKALPALAKHDTGKMAAYRRACGQRLVESRGCQDFASVSTRPADFLTVTLVSQFSSEKIAKGRHHKEYPRRGSIGAAWAACCKARKAEDDPHAFYKKRQENLANGKPPANVPSIHERFRTLLDAELELDGMGELAYRLGGLVRMLVAEDIPIDVIQLAWDLRQWRAESRYVQERWAKAFYAPRPSGAEDAAPEALDPGHDEQPEPEGQETDDADRSPHYSESCPE